MIGRTNIHSASDNTAPGSSVWHTVALTVLKALHTVLYGHPCAADTAIQDKRPTPWQVASIANDPDNLQHRLYRQHYERFAILQPAESRSLRLRECDIPPCSARSSMFALTTTLAPRPLPCTVQQHHKAVTVGPLPNLRQTRFIPYAGCMNTQCRIDACACHKAFPTVPGLTIEPSHVRRILR